MKARYVFVFTAVVALIYGLALVLAPGQMLALYDIDLEPSGLFIARLLGATCLTFAVTFWLVRDAGPTRERQALVLGYFAGSVIGLVASLMAQLDGLANALGWSTVVVYLIFTVAYGYLRFMGEPGAARTQMAR